MRLLPERHDHGGDGALEEESAAHRRDHQYLPLRHLSADPRSHPFRERDVREAAMTVMQKLETQAVGRRAFLIGAAATGGLSLSFGLPFGAKVAQAAEMEP